MVKIRSTATVSSWLRSVAEVLPLQHRAELPYTLGEAIAELGAYAHAVGATDWESRAAHGNRSSLRTEINSQFEALGDRLAASLAPLLNDLFDDSEPTAVVAAATRFGEAWHTKSTIADAFRDLGDAAQVPGATSRTLQKLSAIIASQVGLAANGAFSQLSQAADALVNTEEELARMSDQPLAKSLTEARRLDLAEEILVSAPMGRVAVWVGYDRAIVSSMRVVAGPMTFLQAAWALPNALDGGPNDFPERAELREIREGAPWLDDLNVEALKVDNRLALVRVDLGERQVAGAVEEARRRIEAVLSVAVGAGGVSWQSTSAYAILLDGKVLGSTLGSILRDATAPEDSYGMGATGDMLMNIADQLGDALIKGPMPEHLVEALSALREARMIDHRDVLFYGARPVTPRIATALEDHAMELIASVLGVHSRTMAAALQRREAFDQAGRRIAGQLRAPFDNAWSREHHKGRQELERKITEYSHGRHVVSVAKAVALEAEIRALPMSELQRADLDDALAICTKPEREREMLDEMLREASLLRARHRRVRNAVNHGLPLDATALNSVREYADRTSSTALNIALAWFKNGEPGATLLQREEAAWAERTDRIDHGVSWTVEDTRAEEEF